MLRSSRDAGTPAERPGPDSISGPRTWPSGRLSFRNGASSFNPISSLSFNVIFPSNGGVTAELVDLKRDTSGQYRAVQFETREPVVNGRLQREAQNVHCGVWSGTPRVRTAQEKGVDRMLCGQRRRADVDEPDDRRGDDKPEERPNDEVPANRREDPRPRDRDEDQERQDRRGS
jgi:hypothetical protein